ncbi:MAG: hypothetical protein MJ189_05870 [Coriobacteriales bacterium]|nr:hypothetical protein [Coriobacteriales bacterium]
MIKQLTVFLENEKGRLKEMLSILKDNNINLDSFMIAETADYGIVRILTKDVNYAQQILASKGFNCRSVDVIGVKLSNECGSLVPLFDLLSNHNINVEYSYCFATIDNLANLVIKTDVDVSDLLQNSGFELLQI